ncbi:MAG: hypothetical protein M3177_05415 [Pseudomonadota bacterium]|nr:hypothetical protein [Pseudomonadota bacterium]
MLQYSNFRDVLSASVRAAWQIEDVLPEGAVLDFVLAVRAPDFTPFPTLAPVPPAAAPAFC